MLSNHNWFRVLFGFDEAYAGSGPTVLSGEAFEQTKANFLVTNHPDRVTYNPQPVTEWPDDLNGTETAPRLRSLHNDTEYAPGQFFTPTLAQLRQKGREALATAGTPAAGRVQVCNIAIGDVLLLHHGNPGATFQVASQFNCLEFASPRAVPENGVACYQFDNTQGPACSMACGAATVLRNYFCRLPGTGREAPTGQRHSSQINNLADVDALLGNNQRGGGDGQYWTVTNGYTYSTRERLAAYRRAVAAHRTEDVLGAVRVGYHANAEVCFTGRWKVPPKDLPAVAVTQVFCSAVSCAYSGVACEDWEPFARMILEAAYEATLWAAVLQRAAGRGTNVVFLTKLGGGVFGNPDEWIVDAIVRAVRVVNDAGAGLDVRVCHFRGVDPLFARRVEMGLPGLMGPAPEDPPATH